MNANIRKCHNYFFRADLMESFLDVVHPFVVGTLALKLKHGITLNTVSRLNSFDQLSLLCLGFNPCGTHLTCGSR